MSRESTIRRTSAKVISMSSDEEFVGKLRLHIEAVPVAEVCLADVKRAARRRRAIHRGGVPAIVGVVALVGLLGVRPFLAGGSSEGAGQGLGMPAATVNEGCATPSECFPVRDDEGWSLEVQARLASFASSIHAAADRESGFGSITLSYQPEGLILRWAGELPDAVTQAVESVRDEGVEVTIVPVLYGSETLLRLSARVADALVSEGIEFASVGASPDASAIEVHGVVGTKPSVCSEGISRDRMMEIARAIAGDVPVRCGVDELPSSSL